MSQEEVAELVAIGLANGLADMEVRKLLLGTLRGHIGHRLPIHAIPSDQLESDLWHLARIWRSSGSEPLQTWLTTVSRRLGDRPDRCRLDEIAGRLHDRITARRAAARSPLRWMTRRSRATWVSIGLGALLVFAASRSGTGAGLDPRRTALSIEITDRAPEAVDDTSATAEPESRRGRDSGRSDPIRSALAGLVTRPPSASALEGIIRAVCARHPARLMVDFDLAEQSRDGQTQVIGALRQCGPGVQVVASTAMGSTSSELEIGHSHVFEGSVLFGAPVTGAPLGDTRGNWGLWTHVSPFTPPAWAHSVVLPFDAAAVAAFDVPVRLRFQH